ncbi:MAG TPA: c-type cytochrome biogenesis protein CcsB [Dehalococcoidia bacterium]|nr:c-type cytochrome biogenesis protein CcsB [Dehalococcoidia bacterium]
MASLSIDLFYIGLGVTAVATALYLLHAMGAWVGYRRAATSAGEITIPVMVRLPAELGRWASGTRLLATALLTAALVCRVIATGHPPYTNMWEYQVAFGWTTLVIYGLFEWHYGQRTLGAFVLPVALTLFVVSAVFFPAQVQPLVPALQANRILAIHVGTMILAYSSFTVSFGAAAMYLLQGPNARFPRLPGRVLLDTIAYRSVAVGVPLLALGIGLGAWWGYSAWGRYWGWDPKETSALVTWLIYAGYLHVRGLRGWRGDRSTWILIGGYAAVLFTYFAVNLWVSGLHSYAGV